MKKNKKTIVLIITAVVSVLVIIVFSIYYQDQQRFMAASANVETVAKLLTGSSAKNKQQYCQRNNLKYQKGILSCVVAEETTIKMSNPVSESEINRITQKVDWKFTGNNFIALNDLSSTYLTANLYMNNEFNCYIRQKYVDTNHSSVEIGCSKVAKRAWYPVKNE